MYKNFFIIFSIFTFLITSVKSEEQAIKALKKGGNIVFIRHAIAPGGGDPPNFKLNDCLTQRNLDNKGIKQSKKMGLFFEKNNISIDQVLSSEWCRCRDTAKFAFKDYKTFNALNSFFTEKFRKNKERQMIDLIKFINTWESKKNLILITHYVVILESLNRTVSSGEIVVVDKNLNYIGSITKY
tara:strand:+ start:395 stop:946 length:552 start_codon:yes stop_codon:yes gene_type:complete